MFFAIRTSWWLNSPTPLNNYAFVVKMGEDIFPKVSGWAIPQNIWETPPPSLGSFFRGSTRPQTLGVVPWVTMNFRSIFVGYKLLVVFQPPFTIWKICAFVFKLGDFLPQAFGVKISKYLSCHHLGNHGCLQNWNNKKTEKQTYTEIHLSKGWSCTKNGCFWEFLLDFQIHYRSMYYIALTAEWHHSTRCQLLIQSTFWGNADKERW